MSWNSNVAFPKVEVQLTGTDGNAFALIGTVAKAIRTSYSVDASDKWVQRAMESESYDDLLAFIMDSVNVL